MIHYLCEDGRENPDLIYEQSTMMCEVWTVKYEV